MTEQRLIEAVKRKRESEKLSLRGLSDVIGVSFSTLARIERGEGTPDPNTRIRLLEWIGIEAKTIGLFFDKTAYVHFRAAKEIRSSTVEVLMIAAECLASRIVDDNAVELFLKDDEAELFDIPAILRSKDELEELAERFREDLGLNDEASLESLNISLEGVEVTHASTTDCLDRKHVKYLTGPACREWSAMSIPINNKKDEWIVLLNDIHKIQRQRVTILEEYWHIMLGHKLTKIIRVGDVYGRTYDKIEEHDAYYLASASLLPKKALKKAVKNGHSSGEIANSFGTSSELVDFRMKRLGLWREHTGKTVTLSAV